jgi:hypothetical protein
MKTSLALAALVSALAFATTAQAQQKPKGAPAPAPAPAPAAAPAPAPAADVKKDPEKEAAGQLAAAGWLTLLDRKDWGTAWERSGAVFRQNVPLATWMDAIPKAREPFGALVDRKPATTVYKTTLAGRPDGDYVSVIFTSKFEKKDAVEEIVTTQRESDGKWRVMGYQTR